MNIKKFLIIVLLSLFSLPLFTQSLFADDDRFALSAISPTRTVSKCVTLPQISTLSSLQSQGFEPKQDESGFIYSLIGHAGEPSYKPGSRNNFWSFWLQQGNNYEFSNLGPAALKPQKEKSYVFYFGNGHAKPSLIKYDDVCKKPTPTPTFIPSTVEGPSLSPALQNKTTSPTPTPKPNNKAFIDYLKNNYPNRPTADKDWAAIALGAWGENITVSPVNSDNLLSLARNTLTLSAQGQRNESNIVKIKNSYQNSQFGDPTLINDDIFALLALAAADSNWLDSHQEAFDYIVSSQRPNGSFGFSRDGEGDVDMTAAAIWTLSLKKDRPANVIDRAFSYLKTAQNSDGGFGYQPNEPSNVPSSAWAAIAFTQAQKENSAVFNYLQSAQQKDGYWLYNGEPSYNSSASAALALSRQHLPIIRSNIVSAPKSPTHTINPQTPAPRPRTKQRPQPPQTVLNPPTSTSSTTSTSSVSAASSSASASSSATSGSCTTTATATAGNSTTSASAAASCR